MSENETFTYRYPHPAVTTDCVLFSFDGKDLRILLVKRGQEPCKGMLAFPGGFMRIDETLENCARRELQEETSLVVDKIEQFKAFSAVKRDPRERVISVAFFGLVKMADVVGGDDAESAQWVRLDDVPQLAFDHDYILREATRFLRKKIFFEPIGFDLLDETFTFPQLQRLYEAILGVEFDRRNFKRKMLQLGLIENVDDEDDFLSHTHHPIFYGDRAEMMSKDISCLFEPAPEYTPRSVNACKSSSDKKMQEMSTHEVGRKPKWFRFNKKRYEELKEDPSSFRLEF